MSTKQIGFTNDGSRQRAREVVTVPAGAKVNVFIPLPDADHTAVYVAKINATVEAPTMTLRASISPRQLVQRFLEGEALAISLFDLATPADWAAGAPFNDVIVGPISALALEVDATANTETFEILVEATQ